MIPRCQVIPLADSAFSFEVDGRVVLQWNAAERFRRPFFFPVYGPSQALMTRMGHPGAPDHDHHNSIWFAHYKVLGIDFWSINSTAYIRQLGWQVIRDGNEEAVLAVRLGWFDGHDPQVLLEQELIICVTPDRTTAETTSDSWSVELQSRFIPKADSLEFQQTNFGFLAVRVAKSISAHFGGGTITNNHGQTGEPEIFGKPANWVDYSGPIRAANSGVQVAGITYFNHPGNPNSPVSWHVREDGWMGAGACLTGPLVASPDAPLMLRYLLHVHAGQVQPDDANQRLERWSKLPAFEVTKSKRKHEAYEVWRKTDNR
jgi:Methane oxygenase PmoA